MRFEMNLETGELTEHEDAPVTYVEPEPVVLAVDSLTTLDELKAAQLPVLENN